MALMYFLSQTAQETNVWIQSEQPGVGLHRLLRKVVRRGIVEYYRGHKNIDYSGFSRLINYNVATFKK